MPRRYDLRPTSPQDSLKRIVRGSKDQASVPHGRKVVGAGSIELYDPVTGDLEVKIAPGESTFSGRIIVREGSSVPMGAVDGLLKEGTTVIDGGNVDADTMGARLMEAGTLRVSGPGGAVELTGSGYKAWNSAGAQTVNLDGTNNYMTGTFETAPVGQRVRIRNAGNIAAVDLFGSETGDDHLGMWYDSAAGNLTRARARLIAMSGLQHTDDSPGFSLYPGRGSFEFQGRFERDSNSMKFVRTTITAGLAPGAFTELWVPYPTPFPSSNSVLCPVLSVDTAEGVELVATTTGQDWSGCRVQLNNKSTGKSTGTITLRVLTFNFRT